MFKKTTLKKRSQHRSRTEKVAVREAKETPEKMKSDDRQSVLLITDIGNDIDDTLALLVLLGSKEKIKIEAIVTSCGNVGRERGRLARGYLNALLGEEKSSDILIWPTNDSTPETSTGCTVPDKCPLAADCALGDVEKTPQNIINLCMNLQKESKKLWIIGISQLTPLKIVIDKELRQGESNYLLRAVSKVFLQGSVNFLPNGLLAPGEQAYNFKNDLDAAKQVFNYFQRSSQIITLGKGAAYKVPLQFHLFEEWNEMMLDKCKRNKTVFTPDLTQALKNQLREFKKKNVALFMKIYKNYDPEKADSPDGDLDCSMPYDPLLCLIVTLAEKEKEKLFRPERFQVNGNITHEVYGNTDTATQDKTVLDPDAVRDSLSNAIRKALL